MIIPIQALRFLMCVIIISHHFLILTDGPAEPLDYPAWFSTSVFFMLSGFVLALVRRRHNDTPSGHFFLRRYLRLMPLNLVGVIAGILVFPPVLKSVGRVLATVFMVQSWVPDQSWYFAVNSPLWFMSDMAFCCAVFPLLMRGGRAMWIALGAYAVLLTLWGGWYCPIEQENNLFYIPPCCRVMDFTIGVAACHVCGHISGRLREHGAAVIQCAALALAAGFVFYGGEAPGSLVQVSWWWIPGFFLVVALALPGGILGRMLGHRWWIRAGELAFPLYVLHMPVISAVIRADVRFGLGMPLWMQFLLVVAVTAVGAVLADRFIERPAGRLIKGLFEAKKI